LVTKINKTMEMRIRLIPRKRWIPTICRRISCVFIILF